MSEVEKAHSALDDAEVPRDHSGEKMTLVARIDYLDAWRVYNQELAKGVQEVRKTKAPPAPIETDEDLVRIIDELKHTIKPVKNSPMRFAFNGVLNCFIQQWRLDKDPHHFASVQKPEESDE